MVLQQLKIDWEMVKVLKSVQVKARIVVMQKYILKK